MRIKNFFEKVRALFMLQPYIFIGIFFSLGYGIFTIIVGSIKLSYFIGITGVCALIFGLTKLYALNKLSVIDNKKKTTKNMAISASVIAFLHFSIAFVCTFFEEESPSNYGLWFINFIAIAAFVKITLSIVNAIRTRKNHNIIIHNIKLIDTANALIAVGMMQRAIIYYVGDDAARWASGLGGMFFSLCALLVCLGMFSKT